MAVREDGTLQVLSKQFQWVDVPPMFRRAGIIRFAAASLAFPDAVRLYHLLRSRYFWGGMRADIVHVCGRLLPPQVERARFKCAPYLYPAEKGARPFLIWAIDSLPNMSPPAPDGSTTVVVVVDVFTKWIELRALPHLNSFYTTQFFHEEVVCRYGVPAAIRCDGGMEYRG